MFAPARAVTSCRHGRARTVYHVGLARPSVGDCFAPFLLSDISGVIDNLKDYSLMKKELKGRWKLTFVRRFDGDTWQTVSEYHEGMMIQFFSDKPKINHERYTIQQISDNYIRLTNKSQTIRIEFKRV